MAAALPASKTRDKQSTWYSKLLPEQVRATRFILDRISDEGGVALFSQQGTGKTYVTMAVLESLDVRLGLVVAPLTSLDITWAPRLESLGKRLHRSFQELKDANWDGILLIHPEAARRIAKKLERRAWDIVVWDESQNIKERSSANSRCARRLRSARRRLALSGTPIDDSQIDVWAQMRFVDHTVLGEDWADFASEYCRKGGWMNKKWIFRKSKHEDFIDALKDHIFRLTKDFMNLPPLNLIPVPVQMFGEQERLYKQMDEHSIIRLKNGVKIVAPLTITKDVKKAQITGGHIIDDDRVAHRVGEAKMRKLRAMLSKLCGIDFSDGTLRMKIKHNLPIVIFCHFLPEVEDIVSELSFRSPLRIAKLTGAVKGEERTRMINNFQSGGYDIIVCQVRTGGVSIELNASCNMIFYSFNFSYIDFDQIISRVHRGGQTKEVNAWLLFCVGTIDEEKLGIIESKAELSSHTLKPFEKGGITVAKKAKAKKTAAAKPASDAPQFGVEALAKAMEVEPATVRVKLRNAGVKKPSGQRGYDFKSKAGIAAMAKKLSAAEAA